MNEEVTTAAEDVSSAPEERPSLRATIEAAAEEHFSADEKPAAPEPVSAEQGEAQEQPEDESPPVTFPASLRADEREEFLRLPKEAQRKVADLLSRRESDLVRHLHQKTQELAQKERVYQSLTSALEPVSQEWKLRGIDPAKKIQTYVEFESLLEREPDRAVAWLADEYAVDLRALVAKKSASAAQVDPRVKDLEAKVNELTGQITSQQVAATEAENQRLVATMHSWASQTDASGKPMRPFASDLLGSIANVADGIIEASPGVSVHEALDKAYEQVLWANPQTRQVLLQQQIEAVKQQHQKTKTDRVAAAKSKAVSVTGSSVSNGHVNQPKRSIRETIEAAMRGEI